MKVIFILNLAIWQSFCQSPQSKTEQPLIINGLIANASVSTVCTAHATFGILSVISVVSCGGDVNTATAKHLNLPNRSYAPGTVVQLVCDPGFRITDGEGFSVCLADGTWVPLLGNCEHAITCEALPAFIQNGAIEAQSESSWAPDASIVFSPGSWVKYRCEPGYHLKGNSKLVCADSGHWSNPPPDCVGTRDLFAAASNYWISSNEPSRFEACGDASAANVVMADPSDPSQAIIACYSGEISSLNVDCQSVKWRSQVVLPSGLIGGIWYAAFDKNEQRIYFTLAAKEGIFFVDKSSLLSMDSVELKYFVDGAIENYHRAYYGIAIDSPGRMLYSCDPYADHSIGVWNLDTGTMVGKIAKPSVLPVFQPSNIALSLHLTDAGYQLLAIADWNNDLVHLFRSMVDDEQKTFISYISTISNASSNSAAEPTLGHVLGPSGLFFDTANNLIVADNLNTRIQVFVPLFSPKKPLAYQAAWAFPDLGSGASAVSALVDSGRSTRDAKKGVEYSSMPRPVLLTGLESGEVVCLR